MIPVEQSASCIPMRVVSAKKNHAWIVRAVHCFATIEQVQAEVLNFVGRVDIDDLEWTTYEYRLPSYLVYQHGDLAAFGTWPAGVYICRYVSNGVYGEHERLDVALAGRGVPAQDTTT